MTSMLIVAEPDRLILEPLFELVLTAAREIVHIEPDLVATPWPVSQLPLYLDRG